ncbi:lycopene cyclase family protein [Flavisolibacter nicotianae]|uniref:lycopene cyclase family protein n=1 Tax=Flavisolibacter nicotianae TaxID=2364882 RepID=UPI000EADF3CA|nr:lycopene cyclase family protein [Flavisolibacter nicotianae]
MQKTGTGHVTFTGIFTYNFTTTFLLKEDMLQSHYDYIIAGAGCAGLSLLMRILQQNELQQKRILLIDETEKERNDRTWCFWEKEESFFETIVFQSWDKLQFYSDDFSSEFSIAPYSYKMIRGIDFYRHCFAVIRQSPNVDFHKGKIDRLFSDATTGIVTGGKTITADYVFNSILFGKPELKKKDVWLLQHFKGWLVETETPVFNVAAATLMDFRISQKNGTAFCYVLPSSPTEALVEYTLFTPALLQPHEYDEGLENYLRAFLGLKSFTVKESEFGVIPMTNHRFANRHNRIVHIGTAGGQTKGSSGYTFSFIQRHSKQIAENLARQEQPFVAGSPKRFHFYDSVLLQVLDNHLVEGEEIFATMFRKNKPQEVLAFLNNTSSFATELKIISTLPILPFFKAAMRQMM